MGHKHKKIKNKNEHKSLLTENEKNGSRKTEIALNPRAIKLSPRQKKVKRKGGGGQGKEKITKMSKV